MSASAWMERARSVAEACRDGSMREERRDWVGIDVSVGRGSTRSRALLPLLVLALVAALGIAALRIDLIRTRYALAAAMAEEQRLLEEQRALIVRKRQLRDPVDLAVQARERGFRPPASVFHLPEPGAPTREARPALAGRAAFSSSPAEIEGDWR